MTTRILRRAGQRIPEVWTRPSTTARTALLVAASLAGATVASGAGPAAPAQAVMATPNFSYTASAYGTSASVGTTVKSGASAPVTIGCTSNGNLHRVNTTAGVDLGALGRTGAVSATADTHASPVRSAASATTASVNLLGGLVRATAVKAASSTSRTSTGTSSSASGTTLTGLVVAGRTVSASTAPNTRISLAGFGYLVVNEQIRATGRLTVNALRVHVTTTNLLGIQTGTDLTVSQAVSGLSGPVAGVLAGYAFGTRARTGTVFDSGPSFVAFMPCQGTGGALRTNTGAGTTIRDSTTPAMRTGTITNTVRGSISATTASGGTTASVQSADLLRGLVKASAIKADARASRSAGTYSVSDTGSGFGTLTVLGHPEIKASVAPNTRVDIAGVGTLYLHRVVKSATGVRVTMIQLVLTSSVNGLAAGTDIRVAQSYAQIA